MIDGTLTSVVGNHLKLIAWFDNEFGYTSRMIDWLYYIDRVGTTTLVIRISESGYR